MVNSVAIASMDASKPPTRPPRRVRAQPIKITTVKIIIESVFSYSFPFFVFPSKVAIRDMPYS